MSYNIYDNDRTIESLLKEFNRTQKEIIKALRKDNTKEYDRLVSYRNDIRHVIKVKEKNNEQKNTSPTVEHNRNLNNSKHKLEPATS